MKSGEKLNIKKYFSEVATNETYKPYFCSVGDAITIVIVGTFCGFRNLKQIHQWASHKKVSVILAKHFGEDQCRIQDENVQKILNIIRKIVLNFLHIYRDKTNSKRPFSNIMLDCHIDPMFILNICNSKN